MPITSTACRPRRTHQRLHRSFANRLAHQPGAQQQQALRLASRAAPTAYYEDKTLPSLPSSVMNVMQAGRTASRPLVTAPESAWSRAAPVRSGSERQLLAPHSGEISLLKKISAPLVGQPVRLRRAVSPPPRLLLIAVAFLWFAATSLPSRRSTGRRTIRPDSKEER